MFLVVPRRLFTSPYSSLLYARDGQLLGARIASDGQWRFPASDSLPRRFVDCLTTYEDKRFFYHQGVDPLALARALRLNINAGRTVSGGSTITMQLARIARGNRHRSIYEKGVETLWALHIETTCSKRTILNLYASHAPFGGNVVGLETAAWRYFGRSSFDLSWAETATLAILPNSPALIHPGRNRDALLAKRNELLTRLCHRGLLDATELRLACIEPLPDAPVPLPDMAPHLLDRLPSGERSQTSLDVRLQQQTAHIVNRYSHDYAVANHIYNLAAIVAEVETGRILAYVGNSAGYDAAGQSPAARQPAPQGLQKVERGNSVDVISSPRSTGSVLKPLLYAAMLGDGQILPSTLIADTPLNINGFAPQNFNRSYYGAVPASVAIERSLNVPLVRMLSTYNTGRFLTLLKRLGMTTLPFSEDHYGAALILGGAEGRLDEIAGIYASLARALNHYRGHQGLYDQADIRPLTPFMTAVPPERLTDEPLLSAASIWFAFEAMSGLNRPEEEADWQQFGSMKRVAWKTGTSFGGRDGWAVGVTPRHVVGVWVGNASGEGRPGLTGVGYAAPVLFDVFSLLPSGGWFEPPHDELEPMALCRESGHKASDLCEHVDTLAMPLSGIGTAVCPYHRLVHLSADGSRRVDSSCEAVADIVSRSWFVLPSAQEYYYRNYHIDYRPLPPLKAGCRETAGSQIEIIYPQHGAALFLPKGFAGEQQFIFRAAHTRPGATIFWHVDDRYISKTTGDHHLVCTVRPGQHLLTLTDERGNSRKITFDVK
ncbi:MAG: penicillin-binding protein 1C [Rikenellaceae bacterium]|nr:penicillin-binding protein 1C [Rikenellaceae bacterium]